MKKEVLLFLILLPLGAKMFFSISANLTVTEPSTQSQQVEAHAGSLVIEPEDSVIAGLTQTEAPTEPSQAKIYYTYEQLLSLSNDWITYGPGTAKDGEPAPYAPGAQEQYGKYDAHFLEDAENVIYLTFDCGYEYYTKDGDSVTAMILDTLKEKDVKALFFVTGSYVEKNPGLVWQMIEEGHALGNHGYSHKSMPSLGITDMENEILSLHDKVMTDFHYTMKFFRPPEGAFSIRSLAVTQNVGYDTVHWSFGYSDWDPENQPEASAALDKILSCHHDGAIYLLHALSTTNAQILGDVIDGLRGMGYRLELLA